MFERFRDSLAYPTRILQFRNDSFLRVFSYIFLFAILMSAGTIIFAIRFESLPNTFIDSFEDNLVVSEIDCVTDDGLLECGSNVITSFYDDGLIKVYVDSSSEFNTDNYGGSTVSYVFYEEQIIMTIGAIQVPYELSDLPTEIQNLDFKLLSTDKAQFIEDFTDGLSSYLVASKSLWSPIIVTVELISNILFILLIVLINSWIIKMRFKIIPFKEVFKMSVYSSTTLYVLLTINGLIALGYFFLFLFVLVTFRQTNALTMAIYRVIKKK